MAERVCPWWLGYLLASPMRLGRKNRKLLAVLREGSGLEPGPGMGFFTLPRSCMVGPTGRIFAIDIQTKI